MRGRAGRVARALNERQGLRVTHHNRRDEPGAGRAPGGRRGLLVLILVLVGLAAMALAWRYTPLHGLVSVDRLTQVAQQLRGWTGLLVTLAGFVVGALVVLPLNLLVLVAVIGFGAWPGALYAYLGGMLSALITFWIGRRLGGARVIRLFGQRGERVRRAIVDRGIPTIAVLRVTPTAPFTILNVIFGAIGVTLLDYSMGTALGLIPGILALALVGDRLLAVLRDPTPAGVGVLVGAIVAVAALGWVAQLLIHRRRASRRVEEGD